MPRLGSGLTGKLLALAKSRSGAFVTTTEALAALFPNGDGTPAARRKMHTALQGLRSSGRLRCTRGAFAWPDPAAPVESLSADVKPRKVPEAGTPVALRLNRLAMIVNAASAELSELRHDLHVAETFAEGRPSFPMRCASGEEWAP